MLNGCGKHKTLKIDIVIFAKVISSHDFTSKKEHVGAFKVSHGNLIRP